MRKKVVIALMFAIIIAIGLLLLNIFLSTAGKMTDISLNDYSISEDGNVMTLKVGVTSSIGYTRMMKERQVGNKKYITFYSTYGLNSKIGANNEFQTDLNPTTNAIYFYRGDDGYVLILQKKEETNEWQLVR